MDSFRVIVSDSERVAREVSRMLLRNILSRECELDIETTPFSEEIIELAEKNPPDLFLLFFFNNIRFKTNPVNFPNARYKSPKCDNRLEKALELASHLKETYSVPLFIVSGWDGDPPLTRQLQEVSDWYSKSPFEQSEFENAAREIL